MKPKGAVIGAYALMCSIWGTTWLGIKVSLRYIPPATGSGFRFIIAGLVMYALAAALGRPIDPRKLPWRLVLVFAVFLFGLNYYLNYVAETHISSGLTAVLFGVLPFFTFAFGHYLVGEKTRLLTWAGAVLAFLGVGVISYASGTHGSLWYALAVVGAALSSAFANVYAKRHSHEDPLVTLPPSMLIAGIAVTVAGLLSEPFDATRAFSAASIGALLYLACAGSALAFFLNMWLLRHIPVWVVAMSALIIPVLAVIVGIVFGGEQFGAKEAIGAALVIAGVWIALRADAPALSKGEPA
jgi:drug/metabolite transporter (DMT)-like permease